ELRGAPETGARRPSEGAPIAEGAAAAARAAGTAAESSSAAADQPAEAGLAGCGRPRRTAARAAASVELVQDRREVGRLRVLDVVDADRATEVVVLGDVEELEPVLDRAERVVVEREDGDRVQPDQRDRVDAALRRCLSGDAVGV